MIKIKESSRHLFLAGPREEISALRLAFRYRPKNYFMSDAYRIFRETGGKKGWDGFKYPLARAGATGGEMLRGFLPRLLDTCAEHKIDVDKSELLRRPFADFTIEDVPEDILEGITLDAAQRANVAAFVREAMGVHQITVSGGKTALFLATAAVIKQSIPKARFLYVTPTERLVQQVYKSARFHLPLWDVTQFGGGKKDNTGKDMVVCTEAMLDRHRKNLGAWWRTFHCLLYDEHHHVQSDRGERIVMALASFFRFGASDTVKEDDPESRIRIEGFLGPVLNRVEAAPLIAVGRIAKPHIYLADMIDHAGSARDIPYQAEPQTPAWVLSDGEWKKGTYLGPTYKVDEFGRPATDKKGFPVVVPGMHEIQIDGESHNIEANYALLHRLVDKAIIRFRPRNQLIADWTEHFANQGHCTLVVATRRLHVLILRALIQERIGEDRVRALVGDNTTSERDKAFDWFRGTKGNVLISPLVKEGVSINEIGAGVIADRIVNWETCNQIIGRFIRPKFDRPNEAHLVLILDRQHPKFSKTSEDLVKKLEKIRGYDFYYPLRGPETIQSAKHYPSSAS